MQSSLALEDLHISNLQTTRLSSKDLTLFTSRGGHGSGRGGYWHFSHLPCTLRVLEIQTHHPSTMTISVWVRGLRSGVDRGGLGSLFLRSSPFFPPPAFLLVSLLSFPLSSPLVSSPFFVSSLQKLHNPCMRTLESNLNQRTWN